MLDYQANKPSAELFYITHDPLNFRHLCTTLNLILEPTNLRFRRIQKRDSDSAILSNRKLNIVVSVGSLATPFSTSRGNPSLNTPHADDLRLLADLEHCESSVTVSISPGPMPFGDEIGDDQFDELSPLIAQIVVNHLMNMNPAKAVYWQATDQIMRPKHFLNMINGQKTQHRPKDAPCAFAHQSKCTKQALPSFVGPNLIDGTDAPNFELTGHLARRFETAKSGPKAAFLVSAATLLIAPIAGMLLLMYNFMGGARLKQTAALAILAAALTLAGDLLSTNHDITQNVTSKPIPNAETASL